jgi:hypothetical protein
MSERFEEKDLTPELMGKLERMIASGLSMGAHVEVKKDEVTIYINKSGELAYVTRNFFSLPSPFSAFIRSYDFHGRIMKMTEECVKNENHHSQLGFHNLGLSDSYCAWTNNIGYEHIPCGSNGHDLPFKIFGNFPYNLKDSYEGNRVVVHQMARMNSNFREE